MALKQPKVRKTGLRTPSSGHRPGGLRRSRQTSINVKLIVITAIAGVLLWLLCRLLYNGMIDSTPRPLLIGLVFGVLCAGICIVILIYGFLAGTFEENLLSGSSSIGTTALFLLGFCVVVFLLGMLFQWIYQVNFGGKPQAPTSYIFVIDDSGSMSVNDPDQERYKAIPHVLEDTQDSFQYMVYEFDDEVQVLQDMQAKSAGIPEFSGDSYGGTAIKLALTRVMDDYKQGVWNGGDSPKVILLTDGYATDISIFNSINGLLRDYAKEHISVSTVGLGSDLDTSMMEKIAQMTGGVYINVTDASQLSTAINSAAESFASRDLLSPRYVPSLDFLYGVMRVLFLLILGFIIGAAEMIAYGLKETVQLTIIEAVATSLIGALIMEIGSALGASEAILWLILWILLALTVAMKIVAVRNKSHSRVGSGTGDNGMYRPTPGVR